MLEFLTSTDAGRLVPPLEEKDAGSQVSECELRERREQEEEREAEAEELGAVGELGAGEELPLFLPTPLHSIGGRGVGDERVFPLLLSFVIPGTHRYFSRDRPGRRAKGELATCRHRADCGQENRPKCTPS